MLFIHQNVSAFQCDKFQDNVRQNEYSSRWLALDVASRGKIKQDSLITLGSSSVKAGTFASQVVAAIAAVELPQGQWPDLIEGLLGFISTTTNTNLKIATLQSIGFICETIVRLDLFLIQHPRSETNRQKPEILSLRSNEILSAVIHGARKEEPSSDVQLAAIHALFNSLEFVRDNFDREVGQNSLLLLKAP
jgi:importin subunit beta-1